MSEYLERYKNILRRYKAKEFGDEHLTVAELLKKAEEPDLLTKMPREDLEELLRASTGMIRGLYAELLRMKDAKN